MLCRKITSLADAPEAAGSQDKGPGADEGVDDELAGLGAVTDEAQGQLKRLLPLVKTTIVSRIGGGDVLHAEKLSEIVAVERGSFGTDEVEDRLPVQFIGMSGAGTDGIAVGPDENLRQLELAGGDGEVSGDLLWVSADTNVSPGGRLEPGER